MTCSKILGTPAERMAALRTPADIHMINRENLPWLEAQFIQGKKQVMRWPWDTVVLDESQSFKSQSSQRWKTMRRLRRLFPRMVQLTGTPAPNGYGDLWSQIYLLDQGKRLGATQRAFEDRWFARSNYGQFSTLTLRDGSAAEIQSAVADIVLSLREEDHLDLPPVLSLFHKVKLPDAAMRTYRQMARKFTAEIGGSTLTAVNAGVLYGRLLELASGAVYTGEGREYQTFHDEKVKLMEELLETTTGKVVVVYHHRHTLDRLKPILETSGRRWRILASDSDFEDWAAGRGGLEVAVIHPASAGHGLNNVYLSGAEDLIHFGLSPSLELYQQVNGRLTGGHRRAGRNIKIHHLVAEDTIDEEVVSLLQRKTSTQEDLVCALAKSLHA